MGKTPEELLNELSEADAALLGEDCQALIRAIGLEDFKKLIQEFSGVQLYIPNRKKYAAISGIRRSARSLTEAITRHWRKSMVSQKPGAARSLQASFRAMSLFLMIQQYKNELARIRGQIRSMEQTGEADTDRRKYRQLKQIRSELQSSIRQMKQYTKKG